MINQMNSVLIEGIVTSNLNVGENVFGDLYCTFSIAHYTDEITKSLFLVRVLNEETVSKCIEIIEYGMSIRAVGSIYFRDIDNEVIIIADHIELVKDQDFFKSKEPEFEKQSTGDVVAFVSEETGEIRSFIWPSGMIPDPKYKIIIHASDVKDMFR